MDFLFYHVGALFKPSTISSLALASMKKKFRGEDVGKPSGVSRPFFSQIFVNLDKFVEKQR